MKDCKKIHPLLALYKEGQLSSSEKSKVEKHLGLCADARKELEHFSGLIKALHEMPEPDVPADLHDKIMAKLGRNVTPFPQSHGWGLPAWALSAAAIALFVLLNQYPHWQDTLRVNKPRLDQEVTGGAPRQTEPIPANAPENKTSANTFSTDSNANKQSSAPKAFVNQYAAPQPQAKDSDLNATILHKNLSVPNVNAQLGTIRDVNKDLKASSSAAPADENLELNAVTGTTDDLSKQPSTGKAARAKKKSEAQAPTDFGYASAPAAAPPAPAPIVESLDKSEKALTYSREESVTTWKGNNGPATVESQELVTDEESFQKYWNIPHPGEAPPAVDFTTQAVVVLMAGGKPTVGYSIYVSRLEEKADQLVIHYRVDSPAPDTITAQILTNPWALQIIPKPSKPVVFVKD